MFDFGFQIADFGFDFFTEPKSQNPNTKSQIPNPTMASLRFEELLRCSFCGKSQTEVKKLIAGPSVYICNECIVICNEIINDDEQAETITSRNTLPKPQEIKLFL